MITHFTDEIQDLKISAEYGIIVPEKKVMQRIFRVSFCGSIKGALFCGIKFILIVLPQCRECLSFCPTADPHRDPHAEKLCGDSGADSVRNRLYVCRKGP